MVSTTGNMTWLEVVESILYNRDSIFYNAIRAHWITKQFLKYDQRILDNIAIFRYDQSILDNRAIS